MMNEKKLLNNKVFITDAKLFVSGILTICVWRGLWTIMDNKIGFKNNYNFILIVISLIFIFIINGKVRLY